jgi:flagellar biosynthesis/type III secretory pathway protein FliH
MKRFLIVPAFGLMVLGSAVPARAQLGGWPDLSRPSYRDEARQPYYESRRAAYDNGYREGLKEGEKDGRKRDPFNFRDEGAWRDGDKGFHRSYGDREGYRQTFRTGFEAGYNDAYRRFVPNYGYGNDRYGNGRAVPRRTPAPYPTYPNRTPGGYGYPGDRGYGYGRGYSPAYEAGVRDGYEKGREDARDRDAFDPLRHSWYREADRDYRREYGSREQYRDEYRLAFREGYERGYRQAAQRR